MDSAKSDEKDEKLLDIKYDHQLYCRGTPDGRNSGVGFLINRKLKHNIIHFDSLSDRVTSLTIKLSRRYTLQIIQVYAPTSSHSDEEVEEFYELVTQQLNKHNHHFKIVMGDFNAKIGKKQQNETTIGIHGLGTRNERGSRLIEFTEKEHLSVINTFFKKKLNQKWTWKSPKGKTSEIDYILSNNRSIFIDCSAINRFNVGSDHRLLPATLKINLHKERRKLIFNTTASIDYQKLQIRKNEFQLELSNCFNLLKHLDDANLSDSKEHITETLLTTAKEIGGMKKCKQTNKISEETEQLMRKRREWKHNNSPRKQIKYTGLCKTARKRVRGEIRQSNCQLIQTTIENNKSIKKMK